MEGTMEQTIDTSEPGKPEGPVPGKKRRKYSARQGTACPSCGGNLRSCYVTLNVGGLRIIPLYGGCFPCQKIYRYTMTEPEAVIVKKEG